MPYVHTPPMPRLTHDVAANAAYAAVDAITTHLPDLIRNDADRDAFEAAMRDLLVDYGTGHVTPASIGTEDDHYDEKGGTL